MEDDRALDELKRRAALLEAEIGVLADRLRRCELRCGSPAGRRRVRGA